MGRRTGASHAAYLEHYDTFVICTSYLVYSPACTYIPKATGSAGGRPKKILVDQLKVEEFFGRPTHRLNPTKIGGQKRGILKPQMTLKTSF